MEFGVLGPLQARRNGDFAPLTAPKQRLLLAFLLARANEPVSVDVLVDALWHGAPVDRAAQNLQVHVHRLRRALGDSGRLTREPGGYRLQVLPGELDAERFESLVDEATDVADHAPERTSRLLRKALDLWRGAPYESLDVEGLSAVVARLSDRRLVAIELLYEAELASGKDALLVAELTRLAREHPLREKLHALLMVALHRGGRQVDALRVFQDLRNVLVDELGLEPGPQLQALQRRILDGEAVGVGVRDARPPTPAQLPADVRGFVGREAQLRELDDLAVEGRQAMGIAVLAGTPGAGKTALAVHWAHAARPRFPDGQLYVDLRGYGPQRPLPPEQALAGFLRALGVDGADIPNELAERSARFRSLVDGRRLLIVLDNARAVEQVRPLLPGSGSCVVVITSRDSLTGLGVREGAHRIDLDRLSADEADRLMVSLLGDLAGASSEATARLVEQCARLPLALRIAADLVRTRPARGIPDLVAELADERHRLDLLGADDDPSSAVRVVFSWSSQQLSPQALRVFRRGGLHPGRTFAADAVAALADCDPRTAQQSLAVLARAHLLEETADGRFQTHDLLRAHAVELAEADETPDDREAAISRLLDHYARTAAAAMELVAPHAVDVRLASEDVGGPTFSDAAAARRWLDRERTNLVAAAGLRRGQSSRLSGVLARYLDMGTYLDEALEIHGYALEAARELGDRPGEADALRRLGAALRGWGRYEEAVEHASEALAAYEELGDRANQALALNNLGAINNMTGRVRDARTYLERALALLDDASGQERFGPLVNLVYALGRLGEYELGLRLGEEAGAIAVELDDPVLKAYAMFHRARLSERRGDLEAARDQADQLMMLVEESGVRTLAIEGHDVLGTVYRRLEDWAQAERHHELALDSARRHGVRSSEVESLNGLGEVRCRAGDPRRAFEDHREALDKARKLGDAEETARALAGLGDVHHAMGDADQARDLWRQAWDIYRDLGLPETDDVGAKLGVR